MPKSDHHNFKCFQFYSIFFFINIIPQREDNGKETITVNRLCVATPQLAEENCKEKDVKFCQACETDKCNGAAQYGPVAVLVVAIPVIVTKIFAF